MEDNSVLQQQLKEQTEKCLRAEAMLEDSSRQLASLQQRLDTVTAENEKLEAKQRRLSFAIEGSGDGIWEYDFKSDTTYYSDEYVIMLGYTAEEFVNHPGEWITRIHPDDLAEVIDTEKLYEVGKIWYHRREYRMQCKDGSYKWVLDRGKVITLDNDGHPLKIIGTLTDIDERKQLELKLSSTAARLSLLLANLPEAILVEDINTRVTVVNQRFCDLFNLTTPADQLIGRVSKTAIEADKFFFKHPNEALKRIHELWENKKMLTSEKILAVDGRILEFTYVPIYNNGVFDGHLWVYQDVTERVSHRKQLTDQRRFYEDILNNLPTDLIVLSPDNRHLFVNPTAVRDPDMRKWMVGRPTQEYYEQRPKLTEFARIRQAYFAAVLENKQIASWEEEMISPDGKPAHHLRNFFPVLNNKNEVEMVIGYGLDISNRKMAEKLVQVNEKRYRDLVNYSQAMIITHDLEGSIMMVNPAGCSILGYKEHEMLGQNMLMLMAVPSVTEWQTDYLDKLLEKKVAEGVFLARHKDGSYIYLLYKNHLYEEPGVETYAIGFAQDITHLIKAEKELKVAKQMAEKEASRKETFLANMSHEIRTPMSGIVGIAALLKKTVLSSQQQQYLQIIQESANNLLMIVNDVLDLEKISAGKLQLENIPFIVADKVQITVESFRYKAEEKEVILTWENNLPEYLSVQGDPYRLGQILNNTISNAIKFTDEGNITVSARVKERKDNYVVIEYTTSDTGIGIALSSQKQIFKPYVQERSDVARKYGGTGLGLSISKNLVEMQGGSIELTSEVGQGSVFTFCIPYKLVDAPAFEMPEPEQEANAGLMPGKRILVAEDMGLNQFLAKHILESWGCVVVVAENGAVALEMASLQHFDLILMDIQMPVMNGIEATALIRQLPNRTAKAPIVALTANILRGDSEKYLQAGMDGYLPKPFTEKELLKLMNNLLFGQNTDEMPSTIEKTTTVSASLDLLYNLDTLNLIGGNDPSFAKSMVEIFIETVPEEIVVMQQALLEKDWDAMRKVAHKLKTPVETMDIRLIKSILSKVETNARERVDLADMESQVPVILSTLQQCIDQMQVQLPTM